MLVHTFCPLSAIPRARVLMSNWLPPALAWLGQKAFSLFVLFCVAFGFPHYLHRLCRVYNHTSPPPHILGMELGFLLQSWVCSCALRIIHPRTTFRSFLSCRASANRICCVLFAFLLNKRPSPLSNRACFWRSGYGLVHKDRHSWQRTDGPEKALPFFFGGGNNASFGYIFCGFFATFCNRFEPVAKTTHYYRDYRVSAHFCLQTTVGTAFDDFEIPQISLNRVCEGWVKAGGLKIIKCSPHRCL